jgi:hypothetical protein
MTKANERQVGGEHYMTKGVSHWDYCVETNVPYLEGCATKYISRWRKKNGLQDLQKALHYIEKRVEALLAFKGVVRGARRNGVMFKAFCEDNELTFDERLLCDTVIHWRRGDELVCAAEKLKSFIEQQEDNQFQKEIAMCKAREGC